MNRQLLIYFIFRNHACYETLYTTPVRRKYLRLNFSTYSMSILYSEGWSYPLHFSVKLLSIRYVVSFIIFFL